MVAAAGVVYLGRPMGIVLTVLEPPHPPEPNLVAALPPGIGGIIDVESRLVSPRHDTLVVTTRGLVVRDHVSGEFHGVPWINFSAEDHLRQYSRHAILILWLNERRPLELAITRRLALNIAAVAPVLKQQPTVAVDEIVIAERSPEIDLRDSPGLAAAPPLPIDRVGGLPPPDLTSPIRLGADPTVGRQPTSVDDPPQTGQNRQTRHLVTAAALLLVAGAVGGIASIVVNADESPAGGTAPVMTSEAVDIDRSDGLDE